MTGPIVAEINKSNWPNINQISAQICFLSVSRRSQQLRQPVVGRSTQNYRPHDKSAQDYRLVHTNSCLLSTKSKSEAQLISNSGTGWSPLRITPQVTKKSQISSPNFTSGTKMKLTRPRISTENNLKKQYTEGQNQNRKNGAKYQSLEPSSDMMLINSFGEKLWRED